METCDYEGVESGGSGAGSGRHGRAVGGKQTLTGQLPAVISVDVHRDVALRVTMVPARD